MNGDPGSHRELQEITEEQLNFSALSKGLGFNSGSSAQTNAQSSPQTNNPTAPRMGTGAVSAGEPRFAKSITNAVKNIAATATTTATETQTSHVSEPGANLSTRFAAFFVDIAILLAPFIITLKLNFNKREFDGVLFYQSKNIFILFSLYSAAYFLLTESLGGQSLGKMLLNLRVVEDDKYQKPIGFSTSVKRILLLPLAALPFGLGIFSAIWESKSRTWHDKVTASIVRHQK